MDDGPELHPVNPMTTSTVTIEAPNWKAVTVLGDRYSLATMYAAYA
jgi:hypothetical protein